MWVGFPSHAELWEDNLAPAQAEASAFVRALAGPGGENVRLMVRGQTARAAAELSLEGVAGVEIVEAEFGDIWLRDTGPIFTGPGEAATFAFNGWGGKYVLPGDEAVTDTIGRGGSLKRFSFVLEGGALDHDGEGTVLTTRQCLLNPNRNLGWRQGDAEQALGEALGARKVLWLDQGLMNDHTDGHVDNLARFVAPGVVACPLSLGEDDPNAGVYDAVSRALSAMTDAAGRKIEVARIPSPGRIMGDDHRVQPASHMNFVIANQAVIAPIYNPNTGAWVAQALEALFPGRIVLALNSRALLTGGGSFHCITQQEPA
jgi:agmatine deiminase